MKAEAAKAEADKEWAAARSVAIKILHPLCEADRPALQPLEAPDGWRYADGHPAYFSTSPFGDAAGSIRVRLGRSAGGRWTHHPDTIKYNRFEVETSWTVKLGEDGPYLYSQFEGLDTLAEALAVCEERSADYRKSLADFMERKKAAATPSIIPPGRMKTPAEHLMNALQRWHDNQHGEVE